MMAAAPAAATMPAAARRRSFAWTLLVVRAQDPSAAVPEIKRRIWAIDAAQPVERVALVTELYSAAFGRQRFVLLLMTAFSAIALAVTAAGLFGVLSQVVVRRTREIGIRMALGARSSDVVSQVIAPALGFAAAGGVLGTAGAVWFGGTLRTLLFEISPADPTSLASVLVLLVVVTFAACVWPARAAMRIEPASALRLE